MQLKKKQCNGPLCNGNLAFIWKTEGRLRYCRECWSRVKNNNNNNNTASIPEPSNKKIESKKPIKKLSGKQAVIQAKYILAVADMDYTQEKVCSGCLRYQGGEIKLSHSHIISRQDCHNIGKPELIYEPENITYHCMDFGNHKGCHSKWESTTNRSLLLDYSKNIEVVRKFAPELLTKYKTI